MIRPLSGCSSVPTSPNFDVSKRHIKVLYLNRYASYRYFKNPSIHTYIQRLAILISMKQVNPEAQKFHCQMMHTCLAKSFWTRQSFRLAMWSCRSLDLNQSAATSRISGGPAFTCTYHDFFYNVIFRLVHPTKKSSMKRWHWFDSCAACKKEWHIIVPRWFRNWIYYLGILRFSREHNRK